MQQSLSSFLTTHCCLTFPSFLQFYPQIWIGPKVGGEKKGQFVPPAPAGNEQSSKLTCSWQKARYISLETRENLFSDADAQRGKRKGGVQKKFHHWATTTVSSHSISSLPSSSQQNKNYKRKIAFSHRNCQQPSFCLLDLTGKKDSTMVNMAFLFFPELFEFAKDSTNYLESTTYFLKRVTFVLVFQDFMDDLVSTEEK